MIPYGRQWIDESDIAAVIESLRSDYLTQGPAVERFETNLARQCGARYAVACNSGTAALHMAYAAAGIGPGSIVVVPANTFLATANAAIYLGADVRFCDVDPHSGLMTPQTLAAVLDESVHAVVPVHFAGQACAMGAIAALVQQRSPRAVLIEDASHAIGGVHSDGSPIGATHGSSMITFSFHPVKHIATGEGGAVTTDCPQLQQKLTRFRCHGMTKDHDQLQRPDEGPWYYEMHSPGFNYRISDISCALGDSQLKKLNAFVERRRQIAEQYFGQLTGLSAVTLPPHEHLQTSSWHLFCLHIDFDSLGKSRVDVMQQLRTAGIGTQVHYFPVPLQPYFASRYGLEPDLFPGAVAHYRQALSIPLFPAMSDQEVQQVIRGVHSTLGSTALANRTAA